MVTTIPFIYFSPHCLFEFPSLIQELMFHLIFWSHICNFLTLKFFIKHQLKHKMFINLSFLRISISREITANFLHLLSPPLDFFPGYFILKRGLFELSNGPLLELFLLLVDHLSHLSELSSNFLHYEVVSWLNNSFIFLNFSLGIFNLFYRIVQFSDTILIISLDIGQRRVTWSHRMRLMCRASV